MGRRMRMKDGSSEAIYVGEQGIVPISTDMDGHIYVRLGTKVLDISDAKCSECGRRLADVDTRQRYLDAKFFGRNTTPASITGSYLDGTIDSVMCGDCNFLAEVDDTPGRTLSEKELHRLGYD